MLAENNNAILGRILQLQEDKRLRSATIGLVILDEADKLFESPMDEQVVYVPVHAMQGFNVDSAIVKQLRDEKQVLALSATFTEETLERVKELTRHPQMVMLTPDTPSLKGRFLLAMLILTLQVFGSTFVASQKLPRARQRTYSPPR